MKKWFFILSGLCLILTLIPFSSAQARPPDRDNDGVPDSVDDCDSTPGPISNNGCPNPTQDPHDSDRDGDGNPDYADRCPDEGGPASNGGCPEGQTQPCPEGYTGVNCDQATTSQTEAPQDPLPTLPEEGHCMLATIGRARVNVRNIPDLAGEVIGQLESAGVYPVHFHIMGANAEDEWFLVDAGWVSATVVRLGGNCRHVPAVQLPEPMVLHIGDLGLIFVGDDRFDPATVDFPTEQTPSDPIPPFLIQECSNNLTISWIQQDFQFCDGSVMPTEQMPNEADGSVFECDGSVSHFDELLGEPEVSLESVLIGLLLPAVKFGDGSVMPISEFVGDGSIIPCVVPGDDRYNVMLGGSAISDGTSNSHGTGGGGGAGKVSYQDLHFMAVMDGTSNFGLMMMVLPQGDGGVGDPFAPFALNFTVPPDAGIEWININGILIGLNQGDIYVCPDEMAAGDGSVMPSSGFEEIGFNPQPDPPRECLMLNFTYEQ